MNPKSTPSLFFLQGIIFRLAIEDADKNDRGDLRINVILQDMMSIEAPLRGFDRRKVLESLSTSIFLDSRLQSSMNRIDFAGEDCRGDKSIQQWQKSMDLIPSKHQSGAIHMSSTHDIQTD
jgi:hypothetical protein